jgi:hypothetical protein
MKRPTINRRAKSVAKMSLCEILILPDGKILAHNLTPAMAGVLTGLNPADQAMDRRAAPKTL